MKEGLQIQQEVERVCGMPEGGTCNGSFQKLPS